MSNNRNRNRSGNPQKRQGPQDHQKPKPTVEKIDAGHIVKIEGMRLTVLNEALDDFELLDDLAKMQDGESARLASVAHRLFGDDFKKVMDGLRGENGRVSLEAASGFISELLAALAPNS